MPNKHSRREILGAAAAGVATIAVPGLSKLDSAQDGGVTAVNQQLAKTLSPEATKLLKEALTGVDSSAKARLSTKLPENSEPCFTYIPTAVAERTK